MPPALHPAHRFLDCHTQRCAFNQTALATSLIPDWNIAGQARPRHARHSTRPQVEGFVAPKGRRPHVLARWFPTHPPCSLYSPGPQCRNNGGTRSCCAAQHGAHACPKHGFAGARCALMPRNTTRHAPCRARRRAGCPTPRYFYSVLLSCPPSPPQAPASQAGVSRGCAVRGASWVPLPTCHAPSRPHRGSFCQRAGATARRSAHSRSGLLGRAASGLWGPQSKGEFIARASPLHRPLPTSCTLPRATPHAMKRARREARAPARKKKRAGPHAKKSARGPKIGLIFCL
jgi:hypothetical protein